MFLKIKTSSTFRDLSIMCYIFLLGQCYRCFIMVLLLVLYDPLSLTGFKFIGLTCGIGSYSLVFLCILQFAYKYSVFLKSGYVSKYINRTISSNAANWSNIFKTKKLSFLVPKFLWALNIRTCFDLGIWMVLDKSWVFAWCRLNWDFLLKAWA